MRGSQSDVFNESFSEAWRLRYGVEAPADFPELAPFMRHRSVREYSDREVPEALVASLVACAQSAATSSNLQLWSIISVQDPVRREEMAKLCANYDHVRKAPWFFAFLADHHRLKMAAAQVGEEAAGLDFAEFFTMAVIDASLAAERFVCAAEFLGLGICYIGALRDHAPEVKQVLGLPEQTFGVYGMCLGWPAEDSAAHIKPRLRQDAIWFREKYGEGFPIEDYNQRMKAFYLSEQMKGDVTWAARSGRRVDEHHLTGREVLRGWLEEQGFNRR